MTFLAPWLLTVLLALPLIYLLLRVIPPAAKKVVLPTVRFLQELQQKNPPVVKTPWWIILMRLALLACLIVGLAQPVMNPSENLEGSGPLTLIVDNGWASGQTWEDQQNAALRIIAQARRENRPVALILTAPAAGEDRPQVFPAASPDQVAAQVRALRPVSWPGLPDKATPDPAHTAYWISAGLAEQGYQTLLDAKPYVFVPARLPLLLRAPGDETGSIGRVEAPSGFPSSTVPVRALDRKGKVIDQVDIKVSGGNGYIEAVSSLAPAALQDLSLVQIAGRGGSGAVLLKDRTQKNSTIGFLSAGTAKKTADLTTPLYYVTRATAPFGKLVTGSAEDLIAAKPGIIVTAEGGALPPQTMETLQGWMKDGGILLRFASAGLADGSDTLTPVKLRTSARSLSGSMTWDTPLTVKSFSADSPFAKLRVPSEIRISRQLLAVPGPELSERSWVTLSDDTPLITAQPVGKGLLVLVHTTATPEWSDLPLSGFYVDIFKTLVDMTSLSDKKGSALTRLQPLSILDGYGQLTQPPPNLKPVERDLFASLSPSSLHPPGLYGSNEESLALNLGDRLAPLEPLAPHVQADRLIRETGAEVDLSVWFLGSALVLFIADLLVWIILSGAALRLRTLLPLVAALLVCVPFTGPALADDAEKAGQIHLAYIRTGDETLDALSRKGLENLSQELINRTAVEPGPVAAVTPGRDVLAFYPFLYWPVSTAQPDLSPDAAEAVQGYLDTGGMILIDTRDGLYQPGQVAPSAQIERLRGLLRDIRINPQVAAPETHVIFKSFYLLNLYPELSLMGDIWVEDEAAEPDGAVSALVLTGQDWARIWAADGDSVARTQKEQATRFGVNAVLYALTGNYKSDQIHMNAILDRLGTDDQGGPAP